jgi:putative hemolysin
MVAPPPSATTTLPPPLLRGYLRLGAWIGGPPAHDPDVDCADFLVLLGRHRLNQRHARHFLAGEP